MLWNASVINGCAIAANDGRLGTVSDFQFDGANWLVRWLVVDTGNGSPVARSFSAPLPWVTPIHRRRNFPGD